MKRVAVADIGLSLVITALVVSTLAPAVGRVRRSSAEAKCQSNLQRWADALRLYTEDNNSYYPTNRTRNVPAAISTACALSPPDTDPATGKPMRFTYSLSWVESLYDYAWRSAEKTGQDWRFFRRCPRASASVWPPIDANGYPYPSITYVFNGNLVEQPRAICRDRKSLMMLREFWQTTISELRPCNNTTCNATLRPQHPFLNGDLRAISGDSDAACRLHGEGSYIVFADGHVHFFTIDYYPKYADIIPANSWDAETQQWWNFAPGSGRGAPYLKSIAITP